MRTRWLIAAKLEVLIWRIDALDAEACPYILEWRLKSSFPIPQLMQIRVPPQSRRYRTHPLQEAHIA